ncbi:MAG: quinone-dependent dihydroorotate dehydrogenase [Micavibrio aeruginosavorus]|uniref:Dihydroorotate dehydrogenase (quinone) n=1 Tax=Micavibrio aeruginosavorus TaxID=349221 RepID=A0A7T5UHS4_9BACT|nr:MAG: quinone-dependent dihydroorotate dehydrogenase [Micavibrio aeruginosavorus]
MLFELARPLLHRLDPETAHHLTLKGLKALPACKPRRDDAALSVTLWNRSFPNPVGLAAGFDKNAEVMAPMLGFGFGFVEAGTVTPRAQEGNPRPRVFRSARDQAVINRMGFPNQGVDAFRRNLESFLSVKPRPRGIIGINIGMNKDQTDPARDYCALVRQLGPLADYLTVNISSPNTPGLRDLQNKANLLALLAQILEERARACPQDTPPLLVKLAPDLTEEQMSDIAAAALQSGIDGLILTNTTLARPGSLAQPFGAERGGLSGLPLRKNALGVLRRFYELTEGKIPLIGVGGITDGNDAYDRIRAGASLVQLYSALVFQGPDMIKDIKQTLIERLKTDGFNRIEDAIGADHHKTAMKRHAS